MDPMSRAVYLPRISVDCPLLQAPSLSFISVYHKISSQVKNVVDIKGAEILEYYGLQKLQLETKFILIIRELNRKCIQLVDQMYKEN